MHPGLAHPSTIAHPVKSDVQLLNKKNREVERLKVKNAFLVVVIILLSVAVIVMTLTYR